MAIITGWDISVELDGEPAIHLIGCQKPHTEGELLVVHTSCASVRCFPLMRVVSFTAIPLTVKDNEILH